MLNTIRSLIPELVNSECLGRAVLNNATEVSTEELWPEPWDGNPTTVESAYLQNEEKKSGGMG